MNIIKEIQLYLADDLQLLDQKILNYFANRENLIKIIGDYIVNSGGKKIRSIFALLSFKMLSGDIHNSKIVTTCSAIELIHMATLLHDDVVDGSKTRRSLPAANVIWGTNASILVGDFLLSQAFNFLVSVESLEVLDTLARASSVIIEGEVAQLAQLSQKKIFSKEKYFQIIDLKTSELFSAAFKISAILSSKKEFIEILTEFGLLVGRIFQMTDDLMDYGFNSQSLGKPPGDDFKEGKVTIPLIILYDLSNADDKEKLEYIVKHGVKDDAHFDWVKSNIIKYKVDQSIKKIIYELEQDAFKLLDQLLIDNRNLDYIIVLTKFIANRIN